jgi:hypothetical protein
MTNIYENNHKNQFFYSISLLPSALISRNFLGFVNEAGRIATSYRRRKLEGRSTFGGADPGGAACSSMILLWV